MKQCVAKVALKLNQNLLKWIDSIKTYLHSKNLFFFSFEKYFFKQILKDKTRPNRVIMSHVHFWLNWVRPFCTAFNASPCGLHRSQKIELNPEKCIQKQTKAKTIKTCTVLPPQSYSVLTLFLYNVVLIRLCFLDTACDYDKLSRGIKILHASLVFTFFDFNSVIRLLISTKFWNNAWSGQPNKACLFLFTLHAAKQSMFVFVYIACSSLVYSRSNIKTRLFLETDNYYFEIQ